MSDLVHDPVSASEIPGVEFFAAENQGVECGNYASVEASLLVTGWKCTGCKKEIHFSPPEAFAQVVDAALAHEQACPECPKPC